MARSLNLEIITPERRLLETEAEMVIAPGVDGYVGILPEHAPMVVELGIGLMRVVSGKEEMKLAIGGGFLEVVDNHISVVAYSAEKSEEIDILRAKEELRRAEARLSERKSNLDYQRAQISMKKALNRLRIAGERENNK